MYRFTTILIAVVLLNCRAVDTSKVNGVSFVASHEGVSTHNITPVLNIAAGHASVMPYGFIREPETPQIIFDSDWQMFGETSSGSRQYIEELHEHGVRVMLKPQLWVWRGVFTGNLKMKTETDWKTLEKSYSDFILNFASLAQETGVDIFCIGTELESFVQARPDYWINLIDQIKNRFQGKLTYAANWDEYLRVPFWDKLDFIGVDAYFPLSEQQTPSIPELRKAWTPWKTELKDLSSQIQKPVLFTEFGYRSVDFAARKPWQADAVEGKVNLEAQANANQAILEEFWQEPWFSGGFIWKWFTNHPLSGGSNDNRFTPQNKPAQEILKRFYSRGSR